MRYLKLLNDKTQPEGCGYPAILKYVVAAGFNLRNIKRNLKVAATILFFIFSPLLAKTPHTITIDGDLSDWTAGELIYDDLSNDSAWGSENEVNDLYLSWDTDNLYIGVSGVQKDGNCLLVYLDVGTGLGFGDYSDVSELKDAWGNSWWWSRNHRFPQNFLPDYQFHLYEMRFEPGDGHGLYRYTTSSQTASVVLSSYAYTGGGTGVYGYLELAVPWTGIYPAYGGTVPADATIKLAAVMSGGNDGTNLGSAHDAAPDQTADFTYDWYGEFTIDTWLSVPIDQNGDGIPDSNRSPVPRNLSATAGDGCAFLSWEKKGYWEKNLSDYKLYYKIGEFSGNFSTSTALSVLLGDTTTYTLTGLTNNQTYYFVLTAIDVNNEESGCSEETYAWIHGPTIIHTLQRNFSYPGKGIYLNATITDSSGLDSVKFCFKPSGSLMYLEEPLVSQTNNYSYTIPGSSISLANVEYYFWAKNSAGDVNIASSTIVINSTNSAVYTVNEQQEISLSDIPGAVSTKIVIPPFAYDRKIEIYVEVKSISDVVTYPALSEFSDAYPVCVYEFYGLSDTGEHISVSFKREADIYLRYFDDDLNGEYSEDTLKPYLWTGSEWVALRSYTLDTQNNYVKAKTGHISKFAIFYTGQVADASVYKNLKRVIRPSFVPDSGEVVEFESGVAINEIEVFNLDGASVRKIDGLNYWDGRDENGNIVSAGAYIYQLHYQDETISGMCVIIK